jgi:amidase
MSEPLPEYSSLDGLALADLVRRRAVSPSELLEAAIARAERLNPTLNAIVRRFDDLARGLAATASTSTGPFAGVPFLLKDIGGEMEGVATRYGSAFVPEFPSPADITLVARYKAAGLVPFGKTNVSEFGLPPMAEARLYGPARNPWNPERTPGGSSGGAAAAVAAGIVPLAHASDGGGSIRIPASCCGVVGLKPTRGRLSYAPGGDHMNGMTVEHVVSRSVRDSAAALDATAGPVPGDPYAAPYQSRPFLEEASTPPSRPLRIALSVEVPWMSVHPDCIAAAQRAAALCADLGHAVEEANPGLAPEMVGEPFVAVYSAGLAAGIDRVASLTGQQPSPDVLEAITWNFYELGRRVTGSGYLNAIWALQGLSRLFAAFFEKYDLWLTPTCGTPPLEVGAVDFLAPGADVRDPRIQRFVLANPLYNLSGQPAISLPLHWNAAGLPIGTTFGARFGGEATLFQLAGQLEAAAPWTVRRPAVHA